MTRNYLAIPLLAATISCAPPTPIKNFRDTYTSRKGSCDVSHYATVCKFRFQKNGKEFYMDTLRFEGKFISFTLYETYMEYYEGEEPIPHSIMEPSANDKKYSKERLKELTIYLRNDPLVVELEGILREFEKVTIRPERRMLSGSNYVPRDW